MTVDEVAEYLRLNREVVLRKARKGELPAVKVGPKTYRFLGFIESKLMNGSRVIIRLIPPKIL